MFVKKSSREALGESHQEQIITRAMGVRIPPKMAERRELENTVSGERKASWQMHSRPETASPGTIGVDLDKAHKAHQQDALEVGGIDGKQEGRALESIKITAPGTYELNLPSLFERDELIMAVKEGTYFIDLTSAFKKGKKD